jgi:hypothetical protein
MLYELSRCPGACLGDDSLNTEVYGISFFRTWDRGVTCRHIYQIDIIGYGPSRRIGTSFDFSFPGRILAFL